MKNVLVFKKLTILMLVFLFIFSTPSSVLAVEISAIESNNTETKSIDNTTNNNAISGEADIESSKPSEQEKNDNSLNSLNDLDSQIENDSENSDALLNDEEETNYGDERKPTKSSFQIEHDPTSGALLYTYPLSIPPGRNNMQPLLELFYNSQIKNIDNIFGFGWAISIPYIERINRKGIEKLYTENYFYSSLSDELKSINLSDNKHGNYGAKFDNGEFYQYEFKTDDSWQITDKKGTTYIFGEATTTRLYDSASTTKIFKWMIEEIRDANDNFIKYEYYHDDGQIYPYKIYYTGNGNDNGLFEIEFSRESRSDASEQFNTGFNASINYRINKIEIKIDGSWVRKYDLTYNTGDNGIRSVLSAITESGKDELNNIISMPNDSFAYQKKTADWTYDDNYSLPDVDPFTAYGEDRGYQLGDVNGDGLVDLIYGNDFYSHTAFINKGDGTGWEENSNFAPPMDFEVGNGGDYGARLVDIDGDGYADLLFGNSGTREVWINDRDGTGWTKDTNYILSVDFVKGGCYDNGVRLGDINGDGLLDLIYDATTTSEVYINKGDGTGWTKDTNYTVPKKFIESNVDHGVRLADVNGDGLVDILFGRINETRTAYINDGDGTGWTEDSNYAPPEYFVDASGFDRGLRLEDINGDNLVDFIYSDTNYHKVYINDGDGTGWTQDNNYTVPDSFICSETNGRDNGLRFADVNGDGLSDLIIHNRKNSNSASKVYIANPKIADLISKVDDKKGVESQIEYKGSAEYIDSSDNLLNPNLPLVLPTVYTIAINDGLGSISTTTFEYSNGSYYFNDPFDRKLAGFGVIAETNGQGFVTKDYFHQGNTSSSTIGEHNDDVSKIGKVYRTEIYDDSDNLYAKTINKWENYDLGNDRDFVKLTQTIDFSYDGDNDHKDKATTYNYENTYGNLTQKTFWGEVTGADDGSFSDTGSDLSSTTISYAASTTLYIVGLPSQETTYDQNNNKVKEAKYYYDELSSGEVSAGNLTKEENWKSGASYIDTEKTYNSYGLVSAEKDPRDKTTYYTYDQYYLYIATSTNPLDQETQYYYDYSSGKVKKTIDINNREWESAYDGLDRITEEKQPDSDSPASIVTKTAYYYNDATSSRYIKQTNYLDGSNGVDSYTYLDGFDRTIQVRNEAEESNTFRVKDFSYNKSGLLENESLFYFASGASSTAATTSDSLYAQYAYDPLERVKTVVNSVGTTTNSYDNWQTTITDAENNSKDLYKDAYDNLIQVDEHNGTSTYTTQYSYNLLGNLIKIEDALSNERNFTYDGLGRITKSEDLHASTDTAFGSTTLAYDDAGNITSKTDPNNQTVNYTYDDINRVLTENYTGQAGTEITYGYDAGTEGKGQLTSATTTDSVIYYTYNALGQTAEENKIINSTGYQTQYDYDRQGNITYLTLPDNAQIEYQYNNEGLLEKVLKKENGESVFADVLEDIDYNPMGQVTYQKYANGAENTNTYNPMELYRLTNKFTLAPDNGEYGSGMEKLLVGGEEKAKDDLVRIPGKEEAEFYNEASREVKKFVPQSAFPGLEFKEGMDGGKMLLDANSAPDRSTNLQTEDLWLSEAITYNSGFEDDFDYWSFYTDNGAANSEDCSTSYSGSCSEKITVGTAGYDWEATLLQGLKVDEGVNYILKFKAKAASSTSIHIGVNQNYSPWYSYGLNKTINLSTDWQEYEYALTSWDTDENARVYFAVGETATSYWFDDIELVPDNLNKIINPSFEDDFNFWTFWSYGNSGASGTNEVICSDSTKGDCSDFTDMDADGLYWQVQLIHGISVDSSEDYIITFDAKASAPRDAQLVFAQDHDPWGDLTSLNTFTLSAEWQEYQFELSPSQTDSDARLSFYLGEDDADVYIDNIRMWKKQNTKITDLNPEFSAIYQDYDAGDIADDYQIQVIAKDGDFDDPLWDSEKTSMSNVSEGSTTPDISYGGDALAADGQKYYWRIRLWDDDDDCGQWTNGRDYFIMSGNRIQDLYYTYDKVGNITKIEDRSYTDSEKTMEYEYDDLYRLTRASTTDDVNRGNYLETYSYNAIGNITNKSDIGNYTYTDNGYNNPHAATDINVSTYTYDNNGNLTSDDTWTHTWDYRNRLIQSTDGTTTIRYAYDNHDNRILYSVNGTATTTTVNKYYEITGATSTKYVYANDQLVATIEGSNVYYNHNDHLSGSNVVTDSDGTVSQLLDYYPFGGIRLNERPGTIDEKRKFTGYTFDSDTNLNYAGARYQNGNIGKFISQDPLIQSLGMLDKEDEVRLLSNVQKLNTYSYVENNPLLFTDPDGLDAVIFYVGNKSNPNFFRDVAYKNAQQMIQNGYTEPVYVQEGSSAQQWQNTLNSTSNINYIGYYGHGFSEGLYLGAVDPGSKNSSGKLSIGGGTASIMTDKYSPGFDPAIDITVNELSTKNIKSNARIVLNSCNSGTAGSRSIANAFSKHFNATAEGTRGYVNYDSSGRTIISHIYHQEPQLILSNTLRWFLGLPSGSIWRTFNK